MCTSNMSHTRRSMLCVLLLVVISANASVAANASKSSSTSSSSSSSSSSAASSAAAAKVQHTAATNTNKTNQLNSGHDIEIKALSGEPAYKSVNLTWTVDEVASDSATGPTFTVYYCEMQTWGAHRCRSKVVTEASNEVVDSTDDRDVRHFETTIGELRMATKYLFHVKLHSAAESPKLRKGSGRADLGVNDIGPNGIFMGQSIVIPTKGFLAHATKCLPHASEIEVETGPFFGGRIVAEGGVGGSVGECGIQGDEGSARDRYVMRIDHDRCGSQVDQEQLTVKTFITVQENLGIFTHSTRRFLVVCSYQPDTLTVRASFSVPGKAGVAAVEPQWTDASSSDRSGRQRKFRMVGKDALVLKEASDETAALDPLGAAAVGALTSGFRTARRRMDDVGEGDNGVAENLVDGGNALKMSKYARLVHDGPDNVAETNSNFTGLVIVASLSVILMGAIVYIAHRENTKRRRNQSS